MTTSKDVHSQSYTSIVHNTESECHAEFNFVHLAGRIMMKIQQGATNIPIPLSLLRYALYIIFSCATSSLL